nr:hypothetical protein [Sphingomonas sp.]
MGQFENDRPIAGFDDRRHELVAPISERRLGPYPTRKNGARRPQHDDGFGRPQLLLDDFVERLTRTQGGIPPDAESLLREGFSEVPGRGPVFPAV